MKNLGRIMTQNFVLKLDPLLINPIQDGGRQKAPLTSASPLTFTNIGISPKNFLTFSFNPFATLV